MMGTRFNIIVINDVRDRTRGSPSLAARRPSGIDSISRHYIRGRPRGRRVTVVASNVDDGSRVNGGGGLKRVSRWVTAREIAELRPRRCFTVPRVIVAVISVLRRRGASYRDSELRGPPLKMPTILLRGSRVQEEPESSRSPSTLPTLFPSRLRYGVHGNALSSLLDLLPALRAREHCCSGFNS